MAPAIHVSVVRAERVLPETLAPAERAVPLSLLDATTAEFALTQAVWLFERPEHVTAGFNLAHHLKHSLQTTLTAYPQWCGRCKAVSTLSGPTGDKTKDFPPHARRFGRIYAHFGTSEDPGVEFVTATSSATLDILYPTSRTESLRLWNGRDSDLRAFAPATTIHSTLQPNSPDENGLRKPLLAIQLTQLSCGGFVLAAKSAHPMADITALVRLVKDWGTVSGAMLSGEPVPRLSPIFEPGLLDSRAAGDINAGTPDAQILKQAMALPMHRYDWWAKGSVEGCPWPTNFPAVFSSRPLEPAGPPIPWKTWDLSAPVSRCIIHITSEQVEYLYKEMRRDPLVANSRASRHDAVLAHIWSCVVRARQQQDDNEPVHCDLVIGARPALQLGDNFIGSPGLMVNIEMTGKETAAADKDKAALRQTVRRIRSTIGTVSDREALAAHLHGLAFEKTPQRIWQAFLGSRHILVTTWARAGIYEVDFGLGSAVRYVDGVLSDMDGSVLIKEAPPTEKQVSGQKPSWTDDGVDISVALKAEDMKRLLRDPLLLPQI